MNIEGIDKATLLAALFNGSKQQGMGFMDKRGADAMTVEQAQQELDGMAPRLYFDYLYGRVLKIDIRGDDLNTRLYNRDNGEGAAEAIVAAVSKGVS